MCKRQFVILISFSILFAFGFTLSVDQEGAITARFNKEIGKALNYKLVSTSTSEQDAMGNVASVTSDTKADVLYKVGSVEKDRITHELSFTMLAIEEENDMGMGGMPPDTDGSLNIPLKIVTGTRGEQTELPNMKDMPQLSDQNPMPAAIAFTNFFLELPDKPVKINDKWPSNETITFEISVGEMTSEISVEYTFIGLEGKQGYECMKITGKGTNTTTGSMFMMGMDMEFEGEDNFEVTFYFAYEEGIIVESQSQNNSDMTIDIAGMGAVLITDESKTQYTLSK
ncbi:MAG: hypothetical protein GY863_16610 [bacterium]|nr:hypothetical protein [bacterium]